MPEQSCLCGHTKLSHEVEDAPACVHETCGCANFRPRIIGTVGRASTAGPPPGLSQGAASPLVATGRASSNRRIASLANKIAVDLDKLTTMLRDDSDAARARAEIARLEEELRAARERLKSSGQKHVQPAAEAAHACTREGCDRSFETTQARAMHERRAHDGFNPAAKAG